MSRGHLITLTAFITKTINDEISILEKSSITQKVGKFLFFILITVSKGWHRECFKCGDCAKRLDSVNVCEGPDKDIYCKGE